MRHNIDAAKNYDETRKAIGYVSRHEATQEDYDRIGFKSGLEVHQQLKTREKLFCRCPAGLYQKTGDYDAELIRHMRPTLSELGEYDGTALMEFKTRKQIIYRIRNETACTYDVDDTPPFPLNRDALDIAIRISLLSKLKIVGEVHIARKQYLDGSIPTGFQRTAIIGVEGEIQLRKKKIRLIQLSVEEDSCREVSDIGHVRIYRTDRLGMPLIETVTYPEFSNPMEVKEGADYIRFLNRSTGKVRTGIGSTRADVNVSCRGGTRVEIKGVAHTGWMPELTHNEAFRQWALLHIKEVLNKKVADPESWKISSREIQIKRIRPLADVVPEERAKTEKIIIVNLPQFKGVLLHFTQPGKMFADEITDRIKVIACIEKTNMIHSEMPEDHLGEKCWAKIRKLVNSNAEDAQLVIWGPLADIPTALETIEERCRMAFHVVPNETRKSFKNGTTIFERVLPGADRMYPDTDSAPIPLEDEDIRKLSEDMPVSISGRIEQLNKWEVPVDTFTYILKNNLISLIEKIRQDLDIPAKFSATFLGHVLKNIQNSYPASPDFSFDLVYGLLQFLKSRSMDLAIAKNMLRICYQYPNMDFDSVLVTIDYKEISKEEIIREIPFLVSKYREIPHNKDHEAGKHWVMGSLSKPALGNISLRELSEMISFD